jgi:ADP-ribose pyrophosphatase
MHIRDLTRLTNEKWLNLFAATYEHNGHVGRWLFASRQAQPHQGGRIADAVVIAAVLVEEGQPRRLVTIREFRVPVGGYLHGLPAGLVEPNEPLEECVRRELREETGLEVQRVLRIGPPVYASAGLTDEAAVIVVVEAIRTATGAPKLEDSEDIEVQLLDFEGVCRLSKDPSARMTVHLWTILFLCEQLGRIL